MSTATSPRAPNALEVIRNPRESQGKRISTVRTFMEGNGEVLFGALPKHITRERMITVAITSIRKNPKLLDCDPLSLFAAITESSNLGLIPDGVLGHAYLVPYKAECVLIPGYKGLIDLARRTSTISTLKTAVVRKGDSFEWREGDDPCLRHTPSPDADYIDDDAITHAYMIAVMRDGGVQRNCWPVAKIKAHARKYSASFKAGKKDSPWFTNFEAMARKTVVREAISRGELPVSVELQVLASREELYEQHHSQDQYLSMPGQSIESLTHELQGEFEDDEPEGEPTESQSSTPETPKSEAPDDDQLIEWEADMRESAHAITTQSDLKAWQKTWAKVEAYQSLKQLRSVLYSEALERISTPKKQQELS